MTNSKSECGKYMDKCNWREEEKACIAVDNDMIDHMKTCSVLWTPQDCRTKEICKWDYKYIGCNAKFQENSKDVEYCETHDANESACKKSEKCVWGTL